MKLAQSCPTLCDPMDCSLPGFSVHGIFHARVLEWVAISFSRGSSWPRDQTKVSCIAGRRLPSEPPGKPEWRFEVKWSRSVCPTLCNPMDCSLPGFSVHEILHAIILEQITISYSRGFSQPRVQTHVSCLSCIGRQILYHCATWEALNDFYLCWKISFLILRHKKYLKSLHF